MDVCAPTAAAATEVMQNRQYYDKRREQRSEQSMDRDWLRQAEYEIQRTAFEELLDKFWLLDCQTALLSPSVFK